MLCSQFALRMLTLRRQTMGKHCCPCGGSVMTLSSGKFGLDDMFYMYIFHWNEMLISKPVSECYNSQYCCASWGTLRKFWEHEGCRTALRMLFCPVWIKKRGLDVIIPSLCLKQLHLCLLFILNVLNFSRDLHLTLTHFCVILHNFPYCHHIHFAFVRRTVLAWLPV